MKSLKFIISFCLTVLFIQQSIGQLNLDTIQGTFRVTLIGTGTPPVNPERMGAAILVEVANEKFLFDTGRGVSINIKKYGLQLGDITKIFFTHLHGDHVLGLPDLWLSSYHSTNGSRQGPLEVIGPKGTLHMTLGLVEAYKDVIQSWGIEKAKPGFNTTEIEEDGVIYEEGDLRVTAFHVNHGSTESFGYRIDFESRSVVISGDTGYSENLIKYAKGTNLLIHEVYAQPKDFIPNPTVLERHKKIHTLPETAAEIFKQVDPKVAVAYHLSTDSEDLNERMKNLYKGKFYAGEDLMSFEIGEDVHLVKSK